MNCDPSMGEPLIATEGTVHTGIDFNLQPSGSGQITGRVVDDETGLGMAGVYVSATLCQTSQA